MSAPVVSNAGPLIVLAKLNLLHLLQQLYGRVYIANAVFAEVVPAGLRKGYQDAQTLRQFLTEAGWEPTANVVLTAEMTALPLDEGERESIALAHSLDALLLMDEERGRRFARQFGLTVRGTLGTLIEAHRQKLISSDQLRLYFHQVSSRPDIWISPILAGRLLQRVLGENNG